MRNTVLLADAALNRRDTLREILDKHYNVLETDNLRQAERILQVNAADIAAVLPEAGLLLQDEGHFLTDPAQKALLDDIPVIAITRSPEEDSAVLEWGADLVIRHPFHPLATEKTVRSIISLYSHKWNLEKIVREQKDALTHSNDIMVDTLSSIIECRSVESGQHVLRIRRFTRILLEELAISCPEYNLDENTIRSISSAAALHDIGKISIPDAILAKPGPLTAEERQIMQTHSAAGSAILERLGGMGNEEYLRYAYNICRYHHERWDGGGYPDGLAGEAIPICAQVVGLADVFDALTTERVYKKAYSCPEAARMILNGKCGQFSPKLLECFKHVQNDLYRLAQHYADGAPITSGIAEPLAPPGRTSASSLQSVLAKYDALLHHLNVTVIEIDLDNNTLQSVYNPNPDLYMLQGTGTISQMLQDIAARSVHPDDQVMLTEQYSDYLDMFFSSGLRRSVRRYRIRRADGVYRYYNVTSFRLNSDERKALVIFEPSGETPDDGLQTGPTALMQNNLLEIPQLCRYDRWLTIDEVTEEFSRLLDYTPDELHEYCQCRLMELIPPESRSRLRRQLDDQFSRGSTAVVEIPLIKKDGSILWVMARGVLHTRNGIEYIYGTMADITPSKELQRYAISPQEIFAALYPVSGDVTYIWDYEKNEIIFSDSWYEKFGRTPITNDAADRIFHTSFIHPSDLNALKNILQEAKDGKDFLELPMRVVDSAGRYTWQLFRSAAIRNEDGDTLRLVGTIIAMSGWQTGSGGQEAITRDSLTKLLNKDAARRQVEDHLAANTDGTSAALILIDLDNFKPINDTYGHLFGDSLLTRIALEISGLFRDSDVVARIGGDEFLIYMPNIPQRSLIEKRAEKLISTIENIYDGQLKGSGLSCSAGIAFSPDHGTVYQDLFQHADRALYQAKNSGKGTYAVYEPMTAALAYSANRTSIDSDEQQWSRDSLAHFAFEMLYESSDLEATINSLLAIVGKQSNASRVYIFENSFGDTHCSNTFEWCNEGIEPQIDLLQDVSYDEDIPGFRELFSEQGVLYCPDIRDLPGPVRAILEPQGVKSILHCAIMDGGKFRGYVGLDDNNGTRLWTKEQIDLLVFLGQIISIFLLKDRIQKLTDITLEDMRLALNSQRDWIYVVDSNNHQLRFINEGAKKLTPDASVGLPCYQILRGRDTPCDNCPIEHPEGIRFHNDYLGLDMYGSAELIHWKGKREWLVTCRPTRE